MSEIRNDRDLLLQRAETRTVTYADPGEIIIPGYTGVVLTRNPDLFVITGSGPYTVNPARMVLTAQLRGIPTNVPVTWKVGSLISLNPYNFIEWPVNLILTNTPDPLVKTIEASSYPRASGQMPDGWVEVSVTFGGQTFADAQRVLTFTG